MNSTRFTLLLLCSLALSAYATHSVPWDCAPNYPSGSPWKDWIDNTFVVKEPWKSSTCFLAWFTGANVPVPSPLVFDAQTECPLCAPSTASPGFAADPNDCQRFYMCVPHGGAWTAHHMKCPDCQFWDQRILTCVPVFSGPKCPTYAPYNGPTSTPLVPIPAEKRLITHLSFDGATGVQGSNGIWVANNRVTVVSGPQCKHGNCAHFDNSVLEIPYFVNNYDHFKQFSISYFYNLCGGPFNQGLVINNMCGTNPTNKCSIYLSSPAPDMLKAHLKSSGHVLAEASYMTANDCSWHHVVMSWDGKSMRVYVDATLRANKPFTGPIANTKCPMIIGNMICPSGSCHFEGLMDEISFYKSALTLKEVKTINKFPGTTY